MDTGKEAIRRSYEAERPRAERFRAKLLHEIEELVRGAGVTTAVPIESRVKDLSSLLAKWERFPRARRREIKRATDFVDFVGLRVILLFKRDVERVEQLINDKLTVEWHDDLSSRLGATEFGYGSLHLRVKVPDAWLKIPSFNEFLDMRAEIQVRTAAQHIWAAASHVMQYKREQSVPDPIRRSIHRVSALLETVDLEFDRVLDERLEYAREPLEERADERLNVDLLVALLGLRLPKRNRSKEEPYADLLTELEGAGVATVQQLKQFMDRRLPGVLVLEQRIVEALKKRGRIDDLQKDQVQVSIGKMIYRTERSRVRRGVFFSHVGLVREMIRKDE